MGLLWKVAALVVGLMSLTLGLWPVWVACFGYLAYSLWSATRRRRVYVVGAQAGRPSRPSREWGFRKRYVLVGLLIALSLVAAAEHGVYSPYVLLTMAAVVFMSGAFQVGPHLSSVKPVPGSILLRSRWLPLSWTSLVEVKFGTAQMARALSSVGCEMLFTLDSEKVSVCLPIRTTAFSAPRAEQKVVERLAPVARALGARGAYVLPLDGKEAAGRLTWSLRPVDLSLEYGRDGVVSLNSTPFDALVVRPEGHLVRSAAGYVRLPDSREGGDQGVFTLPSAGRTLKSQPLVWEALEVLGERLQVRPADEYTNFLSSVCATRGEGLGERLVNEGRDGAAMVTVSSLGAAQVQLTRPQLRAIVGAYG